MMNDERFDEYTDRLSAYVDGELDLVERAALEAHLAECVMCRRVVEDLHAVIAQAEALEPSAPERDLWPAIRARIEAPDVVPIDGYVQRKRRFAFTVPQLAAASVALMLVSAGGAWLTLRQPAVVAPVAVAPEQSAVRNVSSAPGATPAESYEELERALQEAGAQLDPETVAVLQRNLQIIEQALTEARAALDRDPANAYLARHFSNTMKKKQDLLRSAGSIGRGST